MALAFRHAGAASSGATQTASFTGLSLDASLQVGDVVYFMASSESGSATQRTYTLAGGGVTTWTAAGAQPARAAGSAYVSAQLFTGTVATAGGGAVTVTVGGGGSEYVMCAYWAGYGQAGTPTDGYPAPIVYGAAATAFAMPVGTTVAAGDWVVSFCGLNNTPSGLTGTWSAPSGASTLRASVSGADACCAAVSDNAAALGAGAAFGAGSWGYTESSVAITFAVAVAPAITTVAGAAALSGSGTLGAAGVIAGAAGLSGSGSLAGSGIAALEETAHLSGSGTLGALATGVNVYPAPALSGQGALGAAALVTLFASALSGSGSLGALGGATYEYAAGLSGTGLLSASAPAAWLSGYGLLYISGEALGYVAGLTGIGYLSIPQVIGGLTSAVGGAGIPLALPGSSQVAVAPPGSSNWQWLGTVGQVTALTYSYVCPGGCDQMTCTVMVPATYRTQLFNPGWRVKITRGGHQVWDGVMDEPAPTAAGWTLTAVGTGNLGANYVSFYAIGDTWPAGEPDEIVNRAITRGLPWYNPGLNASPYASQFWLGQGTDPASQTVTGILNLICTRGGLTWYVNSQPGGQYASDDLTVFPLPTTPTRLLVCTTPVARTLGGDINTIYIRYMAAADNAATGAAAVYAMTYSQNAQSVAAHGELETYIDLSDAGVMTVTQAAGIGNSVLAVYQRASFAGPFTASYGQLLNVGGQPIDPGTDQAGTMVQMILSDFGFGGEIAPGPITWIVGAYSWDDFAQVATITPYQDLDTSLTGLLSMESTILTPITVAS